MSLTYSKRPTQRSPQVHPPPLHPNLHNLFSMAYNIDLYPTANAVGNFVYPNFLKSTLDSRAHSDHSANFHPTAAVTDISEYPDQMGHSTQNTGAQFTSLTAGGFDVNTYINSSQMAADEATIIEQLDALPPGTMMTATTIQLPPVHHCKRLGCVFIDWCLTHSFQMWGLQ